MADLMQFVHTLADEIGPRPTTTDSEQRAGEYIAQVFAGFGLEPEVQEFDAPRGYMWTYAIYHLITILCAVVAGLPMLPSWVVWPAFAIAALTAFAFWMDLDTRGGISSIMPKGPSQNIIGRIEPKARRGERVRKVVIVAHYDSARSSFAFAPSMVKGFPVTFLLMKIATVLVPVMLLLMGIPFTDRWEPYLWYATLVVAAYLLVPLVIDVLGAVAGRWVDGANDNASGVAAMFGVLSKLLPQGDDALEHTAQFTAIRTTPHVAEEADVIPEGAVLSYSPASTEGEPLPDDFQWADASAPAEPSRGQGTLEFETIEFDSVSESPAPSRRRESSRREPASWMDDESAPTTLPGADHDADDAAWQSFAESTGGDLSPRSIEPEKKRGLFGGFGKKKEEKHEDVRGWLGVDDDFDARKAGKDIGTWDNFGDEESSDDEDGWGWKGGRAGEDPLGDPDYTTEVVARIRRKLEEAPQRDYSDKEVWFVATGAEESGTWGMKAFLDEYGDEIRDAFIINIDGVGTGALHWVTAEGMARTYRSDRRLTSLAKRVSREKEILVKPKAYKGLSTDATPALARGYKAMSVMAFGGDGEIENWHWATDTVDTIKPELIERTATFITEMIKEA